MMSKRLSSPSDSDATPSKHCRQSNEGNPVCRTVSSSESNTPSSSAGLRVIVGWPAEEKRIRDSERTTQLDTGPMRLRLVGSLEYLGCSWDGKFWNPQEGFDLFWEGNRWTSLLIDATPGESVMFHLVRLDQDPPHPGLIEGKRRSDIHDARRFKWGCKHTVCIPEGGCVVEVYLDCPFSTSGTVQPANKQGLPVIEIKPRSEVLIFGPSPAFPSPPHGDGQQRCYTYEAPNEVLLHFSLYFPPGYSSSVSAWPLVLYFHSMHGRIDGDNNMFYESDTPLRLLSGDSRCPRALRERFVVLCPQCPEDRCELWLRKGFYGYCTYAADVEAALATLLEEVVDNCQIDRCKISITGSSMGAYAALELAARWPGCFAAVAPVAAHYDLDPVETLVSRLSSPSPVPLWFIHAENDSMCPYEPIADLVRALREQSPAEVRLTGFVDTWSTTGHFVDQAAYFTGVGSSKDEVAMGNEVFEWLASQRGPGTKAPRIPLSMEIDRNTKTN